MSRTFNFDQPDSSKMFATMEISVLEARNLRPMDANGFSDPYCVVKIGGKKIGKTKIKKKTLTPVWNETFRVPGTIFNEIESENERSLAHECLEFHVMDWDQMKTDDKNGTCRIELIISPEGCWQKEKMSDGNWKIFVEGWQRLYFLDTKDCEGELRIRAEWEDVDENYTVGEMVTLSEILPPTDEHYRHIYASAYSCAFMPPKDVREAVFEVIQGVKAILSDQTEICGTLVMTELRIFFLPQAQDDQALDFLLRYFMQIYLGSIRKIESTEANSGLKLVIQQKDFNQATFVYTSENRLRRPSFVEESQTFQGRPLAATPRFGFSKLPVWYQRIFNEIRWLQVESKCLFTGVGGSFFLNHGTQKSGPPATRFSDKVLRKEFRRMGIPNDDWSITEANKDYELSDTYPSVLAVPAKASDFLLTTAASQRSKRRFPTLCWIEKETNAPLCRSSQPMAGFGRTNGRLEEDAELLRLIRNTVATKGTKKLDIFDARPLINASVNALSGKGFENLETLGCNDEADLQFLDIENIHVMRKSLRTAVEAVLDGTGDFYLGLGQSGWLKHISTILKGASSVVQSLLGGNAVLVHCSDGWDRTAQLTSLSQLLLDPHYRSIEGFQDLTAKEWFCMGHKFKDRLTSTTEESSPVFLQFIDCVWQLTSQFPDAFEFSEDYLLALVDAVYSSCFLESNTNSDKDRRSMLLEGAPAIQVFDYFNSLLEENNNHRFRNVFYQKCSAGEEVLHPCCEPQMMHFWRRQHMKHSEAAKRRNREEWLFEQTQKPQQASKSNKWFDFDFNFTSARERKPMTQEPLSSRSSRKSSRAYSTSEPLASRTSGKSSRADSTSSESCRTSGEGRTKRRQSNSKEKNGLNLWPFRSPFASLALDEQSSEEEENHTCTSPNHFLDTHKGNIDQLSVVVSELSQQNSQLLSNKPEGEDFNQEDNFYLICVTTSKRRWRVLRQFADFQWLDSHLKSIHAGDKIELIDLLNAESIEAPVDNFYEMRKHNLQCYLATLLARYSCWLEKIENDSQAYIQKNEFLARKYLLLFLDKSSSCLSESEKKISF